MSLGHIPQKRPRSMKCRCTNSVVGTRRDGQIVSVETKFRGVHYPLPSPHRAGRALSAGHVTDPARPTYAVGGVAGETSRQKSKTSGLQDRRPGGCEGVRAVRRRDPAKLSRRSRRSVGCAWCRGGWPVTTDRFGRRCGAGGCVTANHPQRYLLRWRFRRQRRGRRGPPTSGLHSR